MNGTNERGLLDTASIAGIALFSALAIILSAASQALGLNFPLIPYLQFDVGEVAIVLAFFFFGPIPAFVSSFVEFAGLMAYGQQVPIGPLLKLFALVSTVLGLWVGAKLVSRRRGTGLARRVGSSALFAAIVRAAVMTVPNFYLLVFLYGLGAIEGFLKGPFLLVGIALTDSNALAVILGFTAIFNALQILFVMLVSYFVLRVPAVSGIKVGGKAPWFVRLLLGSMIEAVEQSSAS
jgi:riboflavin transporter FmnP